MGRETTTTTAITPAQVEAYLRTLGYADAKVDALRPLGQSTQEGLKSYGYGRPLRATFLSGGQRRDIVVRTMSPDPFGHSRRADRGDAMLLCYDTFNGFPRHVRALDVGAFTADGSMRAIGGGELFLITEYVDGELYASDLNALVSLQAARPNDVARAEALARYLAEVHSLKVDAAAYRRHLRDTVGSGEGILGLIDSYSDDVPGVNRERLQRIEAGVMTWRWKLRDRAHRGRRTHGDFHPFNILFRDGTDFSVLDCSRGGCGEPADDVTCLSVNYLFFALTNRPRFDGPLRVLWDTFWRTYLQASGDQEVLEVVAPYFTWRMLVLASPLWYPSLDPGIRDRLLRCAERLLAGEPFRPEAVDALLG